MLSKKQPLLSRQITLNAFLSELCPFVDSDFFILYQAPHSRALPPACGVFVSLCILKLFTDKYDKQYLICRL